jgi:hypothetical protein
MANLIAAVIELLIGLYCSFQQMVSTHDAVVSAIQGSTLMTSHLSALQLLTVLQSEQDKFNRVGWTIAVVTQCVFWTTIMPKSPISRLPLHTYAVGVFFMLEIATDVWYSIATPTTVSGAFSYVFNASNAGGIGVSVFYAIAMATGSVFVLVDGFHRIESVWHLINSKRSDEPRGRRREAA